MIYSTIKHYETNYQEVDFTNSFRISSILNNFSNIATEHAIDLGMWNPEQIDQYGWILSKIHLEFTKDLKNHAYDMKTMIGKASRVIFPRYFQILVNDEVYANGSSLWSLLDLQKRMIVRPEKVGVTIPKTDDFTPPCDKPGAIEDVEYDFIDTRKVRYSDLDTNRHMNNTKYVDWVCDELPLELFESYYISNLDIYFMKEIAPNEEVKLYIHQEDHTYYFKGMVEDHDCFKIKLAFNKKD